MAETAQTRTSDTRLFRDIFHASPIGIAVEDSNGKLLFVNPAFCSMLGFSEEELCSKHCVDFSPPEDAEKDWALFQQLRAGLINHYQLEKRYFRRDGSLLWGHLSISVLNTRPSPMIVAMVQDITEKKAAEEARFMHSAIVESSEDAIVSVSLSGIITSWNAGAEYIFGYTETEIVGKPVDLLVPPDLANEENNILETLRSGGRINQFETLCVTKDGRRIHVSLSISPIKDSAGKVVGWAGIARDITQRKRTEEALRNSEDRFHLAAQVGKVYAFEHDFRTDTVVRSPECAEILGLPTSQHLTFHQFVDKIHSDDRTTFLSAIGAVVPDNPIFETTYRFLRPSGGVVWLKSSGRCFFDEEGKMQRLVGMAADVTAHKLAEEALSTVSSRLIQAQEQERIRISRELHDDIVQRLALLSVMLDQAQKCIPDSYAEVRRQLGDLRNQAQDITADVQTVSHELHSSTLEQLGLQRAARSWCVQFGQRQRMNIDFSTRNLPTSLPRPISLCLFRVLQEAVHNASKHSSVKEITAQIWREKNEIHITVKDRGKGFDIGAAMRNGGLGLTSMQERVRLLNGNILINSKPMSGTTIHARIPLDSENLCEEAAS